MGILIYFFSTTPSYTCASFDVEYICGFVGWGVCKQSRLRHSVTVPSQDGGYVLLWQRYDNNKMTDMCYYGNVILHLQQYSHRLNLLYCFFSFFLKHTASAMAKQLASVSLNMLATEGSDFN